MKIRDLDYELQDVSVISDPMLLTLVRVDTTLKDDIDYKMINIVNYKEGKTNIILEVEKTNQTYLMVFENYDEEFKFKDANNKLLYSTPKETAVDGIAEFIKNLD